MTVQFQKTVKPGKQGGGNVGKVLGLIGGVAIGAATGGLGTILGAASTGAGLGGIIGGAAKPDKAAQEVGGPAIDENKSMQRRQALLESEANLKSLREAAIELPNVDPQMRNESGPVILEAYKRETERRRGMG